MDVTIVEVQRDGQTVVGVRALDGARVLFACVAVGARATALALIEAVAFCARAGHTIVTPPPAGLRAVTLPDGSQWMLQDAWLRAHSSREIVAHLCALRAALRAAVDAREAVALGPAGEGAPSPSEARL